FIAALVPTRASNSNIPTASAPTFSNTKTACAASALTTPGPALQKRVVPPTTISAGESKAQMASPSVTSVGAKTHTHRHQQFGLRKKATKNFSDPLGQKVGSPTPSSARWRNC